MAACLLASVTPSGASAQSTTYASLRVEVVDAKSHAPLQYVRVEIRGPVELAGTTNAHGTVTFDRLPVGTYALITQESAHLPGIIKGIAMRSARTVRVTLHELPPGLRGTFLPSRLRTIATVRQSPPPTQVRVDAVSAYGTPAKIANSVLAAVGMLPDVAFQTAGVGQGAAIGGRSSAQTQASIDGIPLTGAGRNLGIFSGGLADSATVDVATSSLNFTTPDPTLFWLSRVSFVQGGYQLAQSNVSETGTAGRAGFSFAAVTMGQRSPLGGMRFADASGLTYVHDGSSSGSAISAKARVPTSNYNTISATYDSLHQVASQVCTVYTALLPCGYGPSEPERDSFDGARIQDAFQLGIADGTLAMFSSASLSVAKDSSYLSRTSGVQLATNLQLGQTTRIAVGWNSDMTSALTSGIQGQGEPYQFPTTRTTSLKLSAPLVHTRRWTSLIGLSAKTQSGYSATGANGSLAYAAGRNDSVTIAYSSGLDLRPTGYSDAFARPSQLVFDCAHRAATGFGPSAEAADTLSNSAKLTWAHAGARISSNISVTHTTDRNAPIDATVNTAAFDPNALGPTFSADLLAAGARACGPQATFVPGDVFFTTSAIVPRATYDSLSGAIQAILSPNVWSTFSIGVLSARAFGTGGPIFSPYSTVVAGRQLPARPYVTASLSTSAELNRHLLALIDAHYVSKNNASQLPGYATVDAAVDIQTERGLFRASVLNLTNAHPGPFAVTSLVPQAIRNGAYWAISQPLQPRTFEVSFRAEVGNGLGIAPLTLADALSETASYHPPYDAPAPSDFFAINGRSYICGPERLPDTRTFLAAVRSYVADIEAARVGGAYPVAFSEREYQGMQLLYRRNGTGYAIVVARGTAAYTAQRALSGDVFGCLFEREGTLAQAVAAGLYVPSWSERTTQRLAFAFSPRIGFYVLPETLELGMPTYLPMRDGSSADAFELSGNSACTEAVRSAATDFLVDVRAWAQAYYRGTPVAGPAGLRIQPRGTGPHSWLEFEDTSGALEVLMPCLRIHAGSADEFQRLGIPLPAQGKLNYAELSGFYMFR